jgi:hypothetical protein
MDVGILRQDGEGVLHRNRPARPDAVLKAIAPSRDHRVIAVAGILTWDGLADRCAQAGWPLVLGHARSLPALQGGKATTDQSASQHSAVLLRGGLLPPADVAPAARRAPRDLLRRRRPLTRQRAARLAHRQKPHHPSQRPESGTTLAAKGQRDGVAARCLEPAVPTSVAGARALLDPGERRRRAGARPLVPTAKPPHAPALDRLPAVPGSGQLWRGGWRYERPEITRCPRVPDVVSAGHGVTGAQEAAGQREGTAGTQRGQASRTWACSAAAV